MLKFLLCFIGFISFSEAAVGFLYTSSWYGSATDVANAKTSTIDIKDCVKTAGLGAIYVQVSQSLLTDVGLLNTERLRLQASNINYTIGEDNAFLQFLYLYDAQGLTKIQPIYPNDDVLMSVVLSVFNQVTKLTNPKVNIMVIFNKTQDINNLQINNYINFIRLINNQNWTNVYFLEYTVVENVIYTLRQQKYFTIISLLYDPLVNKMLMQKMYFAHLMTWKYTWIIVDLLGGTNVLNETIFGQGVLTKNVFVITFGTHNLDGRSVLLQAVFNVTITLICLDKEGPTNSLSGDFTGSNRTSYFFYIYQNPGNQSQSLDHATYNLVTRSVQLPGLLVPMNVQMNYVESANNIKASGFTIGFIEYPPYSMKTGDNYSGFHIDLLTDVLLSFNVTPKIVPLSETQIGTLNPSNLAFSGILGLVQNGTIDTLSVPMILKIERINYFDFATNVLSGSIAGIYKDLPLRGIESLKNYALPFDYRVWITLLCSSLAIAIALTLTDYFYPDKYARYKILMSVFFSFSSLTHGAYFDPPRRAGGRLVMCFWWVYCLFVVVIWMSNYAALLAKQTTQPPLRTFYSVLNQNTRKYMTINDDLLFSFLKNNSDQEPQLIYRIMNEETPNGTVGTIAEAISFINSDNYIFLYDDKTLAYFAEKNCFTMFGNFMSFDYGVILPRFSEKTLAIYTVLGQKMAIGNTSKLSNKYFLNRTTDCIGNNIIDILTSKLQQIVPNPFLRALDANYMIGVFVLLVLGGVCSLILAVIEKLIRYCVLNNQRKREKYRYETTVEQLTQF